MLNTSFQSTRPARGATVAQSLLLSVELTFQSTRPARGATNLTTVARSEKMDFNPRAPRGARPVVEYGKQYGFKFQSTRPARGATELLLVQHMQQAFQSTRPARGATPCRCRPLIVAAFQSTRPARGATLLRLFLQKPVAISIHAPREGRDSKSEQISLHIFAKKAWIPDIFAQNAAFQSVLPLADRQKLLYLRCEPLRKFLRAFASHYKIIGSSGR